MKKMKLALEQLDVDSFPTASAAGARGTVFGADSTSYTWCTCQGGPSYDGMNTCQGVTCDMACTITWDGETCYLTCYPNFTCDQNC